MNKVVLLKTKSSGTDRINLMITITWIYKPDNNEVRPSYFNLIIVILFIINEMSVFKPI